MAFERMLERHKRQEGYLELIEEHRERKRELSRELSEAHAEFRIKHEKLVASTLIGMVHVATQHPLRWFVDKCEFAIPTLAVPTLLISLPAKSWTAPALLLALLASAIVAWLLDTVLSAAARGPHAEAVREHESLQADFRRQRIEEIDLWFQGECEEFPGYPPDWNERRKLVLVSQHQACARCGHVPGPDHHGLHVHHIVPLDDGGNNAISNLIALCANCHDLEHEELRRKDFDTPAPHP